MSQTLRQQMIALLQRGEWSALELSRLCHVAEKEVLAHLAHIGRSRTRETGQWRLIPSRCLGCGFVFRKRTRLSKPGKCPVCHGTHLTAPRFRLDRTRAEDRSAERGAASGGRQEPAEE